jgi:hypothetical protein
VRTRGKRRGKGLQIPHLERKTSMMEISNKLFRRFSKISIRMRRVLNRGVSR